MAFGLGSVLSVAGGLVGGYVGGPAGSAIGSGLGAYAGSGGDPNAAIGAGLGSILGGRLLGSSELFGSQTFGEFVGGEDALGFDLGGLGEMSAGSVVGQGLGAVIGSLLMSQLGDMETKDDTEEVAQQYTGRVNIGEGQPYSIAAPRTAVPTSNIDFLTYGSGGESPFFTGVA